jgi:ankyrin repeat protein
MKLLLNQEANPNFTNLFGRAPIHLASSWGDIKAIEILLDHNANIDEENIHVTTPLGFAIHTNQIATVKFLLEKGANPHVPSRIKGHTPLHHAAIKGHIEQRACAIWLL